MTRGLFVFLLCGLAVLGCGRLGISTRGASPPPRLPEAKSRLPRTPPPPEWFWEPIEADVRAPARRGVDLPVAESDIAFTPGATRLWERLPLEARERLRRDGVLVLGTEAEKAAELRERRVPQIVTIDALFSVVHLGLDRALAEAEEKELAPLLATLLERLETRLRAEEAGSGTELLEGYRLARGVVAVGLSFIATAAPATLSPELAALVAQERGNIEGAAGVATSPLLGVPIDYAQFGVPRSATVPGPFRALAWLAAAPLTLVAASEAPGSPVNVTGARRGARAAMLLARLCARDVDAPIHAAYTKILRWLSFVYGSPDDLTLTDVDELATSGGIDLTKPANIANVVRVDRLRARALAGRAPAIHDGAGGVGRAGIGVRIFGGHASADALALQALVGVPAGLAQQATPSDPLDRVRQARRVLPSTLDIPAWLGSKEARLALHDGRADAFDGYDAALAGIQRVRPDGVSSALHASVYGSLVDALIGLGAAGDAPTTRSTPALERARVESMLTAWTRMRHLGQPLARGPAKATAAARSEETPSASSPVFVEAMPDVVARLVGVVRQARRGIEALAPSASGAVAVLGEVEEILRVALKGAERHANEEPPSAEEATALGALPARLARLEEDPEEAGPVIAVVYSDPPGHRVLATATGNSESILMLVRDASKEDPLLVVGTHVAHHELVEGFENAPGVLHAVRPAVSDTAWRARLKAGGPKRAGWTSTFRWEKKGK